MEMLLIRHGRPWRTENEAEGADPGLTEVGQAQATALAAWLCRPDQPPIEAIYVSPMRRAQETAEPLLRALSTTATTLDGLMEWDRGLDRYIPMDEMKAENHPDWIAMKAGNWEAFGIDTEAFSNRVRSTIDTIAASHPGSRVGVVCHGGVINAYLACVLKLDQLAFFEPAFTSISRVYVNRDGRRGFASANETPHLDPSST